MIEPAPFRFNVNPGDTITLVRPQIPAPTPGAVTRTDFVVTYVDDDYVYAAPHPSDLPDFTFPGHAPAQIQRTPPDADIRPWDGENPMREHYETPALLAYQLQYLQAVQYLARHGLDATQPGGGDLTMHETIAAAALHREATRGHARV